MLTFIGTGSCLNVNSVNNSAYFKDEENKTLILLDMGEDVFKKVIKLGILNNIDKAYVFITHPHSDHIGSLPSFIFWCNIVQKIKVFVVYENKDVISKILNLMYVSDDLYTVLKASEVKQYEVSSIPQVHIKGKEAYGYLFKLKNKVIYYSGDSKQIPDNIIKLFQSGKIDYFYQDASRYNTLVHMYIYDLANLIKEPDRKKITVMHFDDDETKEIAKSLGFSTASETNC